MPRTYSPITETSFSAIVDEIMITTGMHSEYGRVVGYLRTTLHETHSKGYFFRDMEEVSIVTDVTPYIYKLPFNWKRAKFLQISGTATNKPTPIPLIAPGINTRNLDVYYYQTLDSLVFSGVPIGSTIAIAYYVHPRVFNYYHKLGSTDNPAISQGIVPAYLDDFGVWHYLTTDGNGNSTYIPTLGSAILDEAAQNISGDWIVFKYHQMLIQGTLAKAFKDRGDIPRSTLSFSLYQTLLSDMIQSEGGTPLDQI